MISLATAALRVVAAAVLAALLAWVAAEAQPGGVDAAAARAAGLWPPDDAGPVRREIARRVARERFDLAGGAVARVARRAGALAVLELGASWRDGRAVGPRVARALARTALAATLAIALAVALALALGLRAGAHPGGVGDRALGATTAVATAVPPVWTCALLLGALATFGRVVVDGPALVLAIAAVALPAGLLLARHARAARVELARSPLVAALRARGLGPAVLARHTRAVMLSGLLGVAAALAPWIVGSVLAIEHVTATRGLGSLIVPAAALGDTPVVAGVAAATGALGAVLALALAAGARAADPRRAEVPT